jgi:phage protein D
MTPPREINIDLKYNNVDITRDISPFFESFRYVDRTLPNKMDELSITVQDTDALWRGNWLPNRGAKLATIIKAFNWFDYGDNFVRDCGSFEIDDVTCSGPSNICQISAISVGITNSIRRQQNTKAWENITIKQIAEDIATEHKFELMWLSGSNPDIDRWEQRGQSDLSVLVDICAYAGMMIKITDKHIIIFNGEEYDAEKPEVTIIRSDDTVKAWEFNMNSCDIYAAAEIKYFNPKKKELIEYIFYSNKVKGDKKDEEQGDIPDPEVGQILKINQRVTGIDEAEIVAKAALRAKNMRQVRGTLTMMGRPDLYSGMNINVYGFGRWDSVIWNVEEISHDYSKTGGYTSTLTLRGILIGY